MSNTSHSNKLEITRICADRFWGTLREGEFIKNLRKTPVLRGKIMASSRKLAC